ncbi:MAG: hypothetical protein R3F59_15280 [Myxococcota bacterium]
MRVPRALILATSLAVAVATMAWWVRAIELGRVGAVATLQQPAGTELVLSLLTVLRIEGPTRYVVGNATLDIPVEGPTDGLVVGEDVTLGAVVEGDHVRARWLEHAPARTGKKRLGLVGLAAAAALAGLGVRPVRGGLALCGRWPIS